MTIQAKEHITAKDLNGLEIVYFTTFRGDRSLIREIDIPDSVTTIGIGAFDDCSGLTSVTIPNSVTTIGERAFDDCSGLTSVTIPNSVTTIGEGAFEFCSGLTSVTIPGIINDYKLKGYFGNNLFKALIRSLGNLGNSSKLPSVLAQNIISYLEPEAVRSTSYTSKGKPKPNK